MGLRWVKLRLVSQLFPSISPASVATNQVSNKNHVKVINQKQRILVSVTNADSSLTIISQITDSFPTSLVIYMAAQCHLSRYCAKTGLSAIGREISTTYNQRNKGKLEEKDDSSLGSGSTIVEVSRRV